MVKTKMAQSGCPFLVQDVAGTKNPLKEWALRSAGWVRPRSSLLQRNTMREERCRPLSRHAFTSERCWCAGDSQNSLSLACVLATRFCYRDACTFLGREVVRGREERALWPYCRIDRVVLCYSGLTRATVTGWFSADTPVRPVSD